jgi:hypothetical protein
LCFCFRSVSTASLSPLHPDVSDPLNKKKRLEEYGDDGEDGTRCKHFLLLKLPAAAMRRKKDYNPNQKEVNKTNTKIHTEKARRR